MLSGASGDTKQSLSSNSGESAVAQPKEEPTSQADKNSVDLPTITGRVTVILSEAATIGDPEQPDYEDMLVAAVGTITEGPHKGRRIKVLTFGMLDRKLQPVLQHWRNGAELVLKVSDLQQEQQTQPKLLSMDRFDEVEDLLMAEYWAEVLHSSL